MEIPKSDLFPYFLVGVADNMQVIVPFPTKQTMFYYIEFFEWEKLLNRPVFLEMFAFGEKIGEISSVYGSDSLQ